MERICYYITIQGLYKVKIDTCYFITMKLINLITTLTNMQSNHSNHSSRGELVTGSLSLSRAIDSRSNNTETFA